MLVIFFFVVGGCYYLGRISTSLGRFFASMGARITSIYCIHWGIYGFLYLALVCILGDEYAPLWTVPPVAAAVFALSDLLSRLYKRMTAKKKS
jgi:surface polysaccharide O-acyltransferase-like enzyme